MVRQEVRVCWHPTDEIVVAPPDGAVCQACGQKVDWSKEPTHGIVGTYNRGCRCAECRAVHSERMRRERAVRAALVATGDPSVPHGTDSAYFNWGCRCELCKAMGAIGNKRRRGAQRKIKDPEGGSGGS